MKTIKLLFCITFLFFQGSYVCGQNWLWGAASHGGIKLNDYASPVATDKDGDAYITGQYISAVIFGNDTLTNTIYNAYLTKYNSAGTVIWAKQVIDTSGSFGISVATDKPGNVYITGLFSGNAQVGKFSLTDSSTNIYSSDVFLAKYNANGTVLWAKQANIPFDSGYSSGAGYSVAIDIYGNEYITGIFTDTISFGGFTLNTKYFQGEDAFLVKYDSNGNVLWAKQSEIPSAASGGTGTSVATDNSGNAYITGYFFDTLSFGLKTLISPYVQSSYLVKYSPAGNVLWAKQSTPNSFFSTCSSNCITTDGKGNPYITGNFMDTVQFGLHSLYSNLKGSVFLTKYDASGNVIWAKQSSPAWAGTGLASDGFKHIYMAGKYQYPYLDTLKFANYTLTPDTTAVSASFLIEFDTAGTPLCGSIINNIGNGQSYNGVTSYLAGTYVYTASMQLADTVFCGPDTLLPHGYINTFVARWLPCDNEGEGISKIIAQNGNVILYPNPSNGVFTLQASSAELIAQNNIEVYNMLGERVYAKTLHSVQGDNTVNISSQPNGIYLYRVVNENGELIGEGKLIIAR